MYRKTILILAIIFIRLIAINAPVKKISEIDSLLLKADNASGIEKIDILIKLGEITISKDPGRSYEFISDAIRISKETDNKEKAAASFILLGKMYQTQGKYQKAINTFQIVQSAYEALGNRDGVANASNFIGIAYYYMGEYDKSLESYQNSLKIYEKSQSFEKMVKSLNNIGVVYDETQNYNKALEYYSSALIINRQINDKKGIAASLNNIGNCYYYNGDTEKALDFFNQSIFLKKETGDFKGLANSYFNLARIYFLGEEYLKALEYYEKCRNIEEENGYMEGLTNSFLYIGYTYDKLNDKKKAFTFFTKSLAIADSLNMLPAQKNSYAALSDLNYSMGKYEQAFDYYREYIKRKDEIFDEEKHNQIAELETKFQVEKKEQEIGLFESEIKQQKLLITFAIAGIVVLIVFLILMIRLFRQKKKINIKLEKYNQEIEAQKMDITSSIEYAQRIQAAILPENEYINALLPENFILYLPKDIVSGDFYWVEDHNEFVYIAVVDCTGHGVPGAFMSLIGNILLNEIIVEKKIYVPAEMLNMLNYLVKISLKQEHFRHDNLDGMDIALCSIDRKNLKLQFSGANRDLYIIRNNELIVTDADNNSIAGITDNNYSFKNHEIDICKGDMIYLSTDGFADQFGGNSGKKYMIKNFRNTLLQIQSLEVSEQKEKLSAILNEWKGEYQQVDDILVVGIRI